MGDAVNNENQSKHKASEKMYLILKGKYEFSDEEIPDDNNHERIVLYKWTNSCERFFCRYFSDK